MYLPIMLLILFMLLLIFTIIGRLILRRFKLYYSIPYLVSCIVYSLSEICILMDIQDRIIAKIIERSEKAKDILAKIEELVSKQRKKINISIKIARREEGVQPH